MSVERKIRLLVSKSRVYKSSFRKAVEKGDKEAAGKWKAGYQTIIDEIDELKQKLA